MIVKNGGPSSPIDEAVLFPFDIFSIPLKYRLQADLISSTNPYNPHETVLSKGKPEEPDGENISFYGTVIRIDGEFRMWYPGVGQDKRYRACYAVSRDGVHWEKPALGLVEYNGSNQNNLVSVDEDEMFSLCLVLYEPEDPNQDRRFKMIYEVNPFYIGAAFSPDGLRWKVSAKNPIIKHNALEPGGLTKFNGCYYLNGQGGNLGTKRALVTYMSYDFDHWVDAVALGFRRDIHPHQQFPGPHAGEQVHLGASLWNRGNVVLGFYGMWHGPESNDRGFVTMDIGFLVSNDAMHFWEPIPDFKIISSYEVYPTNNQGLQPAPSLEQGQGFENVGDQTLTWYSPWYGGFVCVARWPRDRLGYFAMVKEPRTKMPVDTHSLRYAHVQMKAEPYFISCPIDLERPKTRILINADGLSEDGCLKVEILDQQFRPLPDFSGDNCIPLAEPGFRQPVSWRSKQSLEKFEHPIRVKVSWEGNRAEDIYLYAVYLCED